MRHTIGGTWLFQLMLLFILLFTAYIILTINYSKTIKIKNEVVSMIEKYEGLNDQSLELINNYLLAAGYGTTGICVSNENTSWVYGAIDLTSATLELAQPGERYYYCVKKYKGTNLTSYYQVGLFYKFNLPVIGNTANFNVKGTTTNFHAKDNSDYCYNVDGTCGNTGNTSTNAGSRPAQATKTYTVSFKTYNGTNIAPVQVTRGDTVSSPGNLTRSGYTFKGWFLGKYQYDFSKPINSDITLVARWEVYSRVPSRSDIQGFIMWNDKYYKCNVGNTPVRSCMYGYSARPEYASNRTYWAEEILKDYQAAKGITFTEAERQEFINNWK